MTDYKRMLTENFFSILIRLKHHLRFVMIWLTFKKKCWYDLLFLGRRKATRPNNRGYRHPSQITCQKMNSMSSKRGQESSKGDRFPWDCGWPGLPVNKGISFMVGMLKLICIGNFKSFHQIMGIFYMCSKIINPIEI